MAMSYTRGYGPDKIMKTLYAKKRILDDTMEAIAEQSAREIMELSRDNAPIDEGHLEEAHRVIQRFTRSGNFAFDVEVDPNVADVGDYLDFIHNHAYNLGELSLEKAASGKAVGNRFLQRAFDAKRPVVIERMREATRRFTR